MNDAWSVAIGHYGTWQRAAGRAESTIRLARLYLERLARQCPDPWAVTGDDLTAFMTSAVWAAETKKSARTALRGFYLWAAVTGRVGVSPADILAPVRIPRALPRPAPTEAVMAALARADDVSRLMLYLAMYAGLRCSEVAAVHLGRDIADGILTVRGKGGHERRVPLHPALAAELVREVDRRRAGSAGSGFRYRTWLAPDGWLFPGQSGGHVTGSPVVKRLSELLGSELSGHTLRHRFATQAYAVERDLRAVQELLGHTRPETTARYTQVPADALRAAVFGVPRLTA